MKDYKRFTEKDEFGNADIIGVSTEWICNGLPFNDAKILQEAIERFAELEDKIEQGLVLELPCKVGDTVYFIDEKCWRWEMIVVEIAILKKNIVCKIGNGGKQVLYVYKEDFGKKVFLTKAEADKKLAELRGGE